MPKSDVAISAPPQIITSACEYCICLNPSPILCVPVVHAVTIDKFGPLNPYLIDKLPEIILMMVAGTKNGDILLEPLF